MPIRRLNYTGRERLLQTDARITIRPGPSSTASFDAELHLADYGLPNDGVIYVEAYRQTAWMRFEYGTVGLVRPPDDRLLTEFESADAVLFRVKVTSGRDPKGLLLAEIDGIPPKQRDEKEGRRVPLLDVKSSDTLGQEIFKVDFSDRPLLLINRKVGDWRALAKEPAFVSMVYPQVLREILNRVFRIEEYDDPSDRDDWRAQWLRFALLLEKTREVPDVDRSTTEEIDDWIDASVAAFARRIGVLTQFQRFQTGSEDL